MEKCGNLVLVFLGIRFGVDNQTSVARGQKDGPALHTWYRLGAKPHSATFPIR